MMSVYNSKHRSDATGIRDGLHKNGIDATVQFGYRLWHVLVPENQHAQARQLVWGTGDDNAPTAA